MARTVLRVILFIAIAGCLVAAAIVAARQIGMPIGLVVGAGVPIALVIFIILDLAHAKRLARSLAWSANADQVECVHGQMARIGFTLANTGSLTAGRVNCLYRITDQLNRISPCDVTFSLGPRETRDMGLDFEGANIGTYTIWAGEAFVFGWLGIKRFAVRGECSTRVVVLPLVDDGNGRTASGSAMPCATSASERLARPLDAGRLGLRTALLDRDTACSGIVVVLDPRCPECAPDDSLAVYDRFVESALSLGVQARCEGAALRYSFATSAGNARSASVLDPRFSPSALMAAIPRLDTQADGSRAVRLVEHELTQLDESQALVVFTARLDGTLADGLAKCARKARREILVAEIGLAGTDRESRIPVERLEKAGVKVIAPATAPHAATSTTRVGFIAKDPGSSRAFSAVALAVVIALVCGMGIALLGVALAALLATDIALFWLAIALVVVVVAIVVAVPFIKAKRRRRAFYRDAVALPVREYVSTMYGFFLDRFAIMGMDGTDTLTPYEFAHRHELDLWHFAHNDSGANFPRICVTYVKAAHSSEPLTQDELASYHDFYRAFYRNCRAYLGTAKYLRLYSKL